MKILVTGGAGFIGSALVLRILREGVDQVVNLDKLTYAAVPGTLGEAEGHAAYAFEKADVCDDAAVRAILEKHRPDAIMHLAAETHVDRSIDGPAEFLKTNVVGTYTLLEAALDYCNGLDSGRRQAFRFHHISTDEVFGALGVDDDPFCETTPYDPRSPYSASKASSDHFVRAWGHTYGLPVVISNCSNNYGPYQFPEKLIPLMIINAIRGKPLPVYGKGENVRDWIHVEDHAAALLAIVRRGRPGATYLAGGGAERRNIDVVTTLCDLLDKMLPDSPHAPHKDLIRYVEDRPGHDLRYAIDDSRIRQELDWRPQNTFEEGLRQTVRWYLDNEAWWGPLLGERYGGERLGLREGKNP